MAVILHSSLTWETALSYMACAHGSIAAGNARHGRGAQCRLRDEPRGEADGQRLRVIGKGTGGLWCLYAAVFDSRIKSIISMRSLLSYRTLAQTDRYRYGANVFVPEILLSLDLPQVAAAMVDRPLALLSPLGAMQNPIDTSTAEATYEWTRAVYSSAGLSELFRIEVPSTDRETAANYLNIFEHFERVLSAHHGEEGGGRYCLASCERNLRRIAKYSDNPSL